MKGKFVLLVLFGLFLVSCGNSFNTKSSKGDTVDVSLQIPLEILASASSREASVTSTSNSLEVSLFVNDEEPIKKTVKNFSKSASISFKNITIGSMVKAQAKLVYQGKEYSGESKSTIVTADGTELSLILKSKSNTEEKTAGISLYFDDILLTVYPQEHNTTIQTIKTELSLMGFEEETDFTVQNNKIYLTESGLDKFLIMVSENEREPAELLLVYNKRMIGAISSKQAGLLEASLSQSDYEIRSSRKVLILKNPMALKTYSELFGEDQEDNVFQNEVSGELSINESRLIFTPWNDAEGKTSYRFMVTIPLDSILQGKHLSDGDTVAFVLSTEKLTNDIFENNGVVKFYYQLQVDNWQEQFYDGDTGMFDDTEIFKNNNCINFDPQNSHEYTFVMPLNLIQDPQDYKNLQLFFDFDKTADEIEYLELDCAVSYTIFPAKLKAYVFGVGKSWDGVHDYRYEINVPLRDYLNNPLDLRENYDVEVYLNGTIGLFYNNSFGVFPVGSDFYAELYDNAEYENSSFHALSKDEISAGVPVEGNVKQLKLGSDSCLEDYGRFVFKSIQAPNAYVQNDYKFQCHTACENTDALLVITGFSCTNQVITN